MSAVVLLIGVRTAHAQLPDDPEPTPAPADAGSDLAPVEPRDTPLHDLDLPEIALTNAQIIGSDSSASRILDANFRMGYLSQYGHGFQSQDGTRGQAGSEAMHIYLPSALFDVQQNEHITHQIYIPVDAISFASPHAVDAITTASEHNYSIDVDVRTTYQYSENNTYTTRVKLHAEEPLGGGLVGAGYTRHLADDNATIGVNASVDVDGFDKHNDHGDYLGKGSRETMNAGATASQLLSPTTVLEGSYGITTQYGTLDGFNGWECVPLANGQIISETFPDHRLRQDWTARISQNIPWTQSTLKLFYRYYRDDFSVRANSIEVDAYQYIVPWLYLRGSYRFHRQNAVDFFTTSLEVPYNAMSPHTADSDLAAFDANEWSVEAVIVRGRAPTALRSWTLSAEVLRYWRTNDLDITTVALSAGRSFL